MAKIRGERSPQQERSRRSRDSMVATARELLVERGLDGLTVAEVARRAGGSVGTLYGRLGDRAGLLHVVHDEVTSSVRDRQIEGLKRLYESRLSNVDLIREAIRVYVTPFREEEHAMRELAFYGRLDPYVAAHGREVAAKAIKCLAKLLREKARLVGDVDREALTCAQLMFSTAMFRVVFGADMFRLDERPDPNELKDWDRLVETLAMTCAAYLGRSGRSARKLRGKGGRAAGSGSR